MTQQRPHSYGQQRTFIGLEKYAIGRRLDRAKRLITEMQESSQKTEVLELGCGYSALNLVDLSQSFPHIRFTGVDLAVSSSPEPLSLIQADLSSWVPDKVYDGVLSLAVAEHLLSPVSHFALISRSLRPGGWAGITTPTPQAHMILSIFAKFGIFDREEIEDHKLYLTETGLRRCIEDAGLVIEEYEPFSLGLNQWVRVSKA